MFSLESIPLCCRYWRLSSLEKRSKRTRSRFREVPNLKRRYIVFKINKYVMSFFFPNHCSMCDWIFFYDHMMMLIKLLFHVYFIIIVLYVVILVLGRYNLFCRSLGARGARGGLKGCLDQPLFVKVWTILISETCLYMLDEHYTSTFQPQYVDGVLNPSHRKFSFTIVIHKPCT